MDFNAVGPISWCAFPAPVNVTVSIVSINTKAHWVVLPNADVRNADRQWLKPASEVVRKVGWLPRYR